MLNHNSTEFLTPEQIRKLAPTVFSSQSAPNVSKHYTHIPTSVIMEDMQKLGWGVVDAKQVKARSASKDSKNIF